MPRVIQLVSSALTLFALAAFAASCGSTTSQYRVVQTIPDSPVNFDISVNGSNVFTNVGFEATEPSSGYKSIGSGADPIAVFQTGTTTPVISSSSLNLSSGTKYTVFLMGRYQGTNTYAPSVFLKTDNNTAPASGNGSFRFVHASPSAPVGLDASNGVDIYIEPAGTGINGTPTVPSLQFGAASAYIPEGAEANGTPYTIFVTANGETIPFVTYPFTLNSGSIRTIVLVDIPGGGELSGQPMILSDLN